MTYVRRDLVFSGSIAANTPPGTVIYAAALNPSGQPVGGSNSIIAAYLNYKAPEWENFRFRKARFVVKRTGATTVGGTFTHGIDADVTDFLPTGSIAAVQRLEGQGGSTHTYAEGGTTNYNKANSSKFVSSYWTQPNSATTSADQRQAAQGKYWLITNEPPQSWFSSSSSTGVAIFIQVFLEYEVQFTNATLETGAVTPARAPMGAGHSTSSLSLVGASDPYALGSITTLPWSQRVTAGTSQNACVGTVFGTNGGSCIAFPQNTLWDDVSTALVLFRSSFGSTNDVLYTATEISGATGATAASSQVHAEGLGSIHYCVVTLGSNSPTVSVAGACQRVNGGFQPLLSGFNGPCWAAVRFVGNADVTASSFEIWVIPLLAYGVTTIDRMLLCGGPATLEHKYAQTWPMTGPLEEHVLEQKTRAAETETDAKALLCENRLLHAELRAEEKDHERLVRTRRPIVIDTEHTEYAVITPPSRPPTERKVTGSKK